MHGNYVLKQPSYEDIEVKINEEEKKNVKLAIDTTVANKILPNTGGIKIALIIVIFASILVAGIDFLIIKKTNK